MTFRHADAGAGAASNASRHPGHGYLFGQAAIRDHCQLGPLPTRRRNRCLFAANSQKAQAEQEISCRLRKLSKLSKIRYKRMRSFVLFMIPRPAMPTAPQCAGLPSAHPLHSRRSAALARETRDSIVPQILRPSVDLSDSEPTVAGHFLPKRGAQPHQLY